MQQRSDPGAERLSAEVLRSTQPVLLRGLVRHWPLVQAAGRSDAEFCDYLRGFGEQTRLMLWRGGSQIGGRFFYNDDFSGFNFAREIHTLGALLDELLAGTPESPVFQVFWAAARSDSFAAPPHLLSLRGSKLQ